MSSKKQRNKFRDYLIYQDSKILLYFDIWLIINQTMSVWQAFQQQELEPFSLCVSKSNQTQEQTQREAQEEYMAEIVERIGLGTRTPLPLPNHNVACLQSLETHILQGDWNVSHIQPLFELITDILGHCLTTWNSEKKRVPVGWFTPVSDS